MTLSKENSNIILFWKEIFMGKVFMNIGISAAAGLIIILPFAFMELINKQSQENFPFPLFGFLWFLAAAFFLILMLLLKNLNSLSFYLRGIFLVFIACMWIAIIIDQMPCFIGLPNCD